MALFEVEGWDIKSKDVAYAGESEKKKEKRKEMKQKKKERKRELKAKTQQQVETAEDIGEDAKDAKNKKHKMEEDPKDSSSKKKKVSHKGQDLERKEEPIEPLKDEQPVMPLMDNLTPLQQKMMAKLSGSRFRWINEKLYTIDSESALKLIKEQPALFDEYHQGFRSQVQSWPENPVDVFVDQVRQRSRKPVNAPGGLPGLPNKQVVVADMGCGEAQLALDISKFLQSDNKSKKQKKQKGNNGRKPDIVVHSFDLKKVNDRITVADIKNVPLPDNSCTVVIFCLALMGTNFLDFVDEAYRILAPRGELWIAEIKSRFTENDKKQQKVEIGEQFIDAIKMNGFFHKHTDNSNKMFTRFEFFKPPKEIMEERKQKLQRKKRFVEQETEVERLKQKRQEHPEGEWLLKPCIYKRR